MRDFPHRLWRWRVTRPTKVLVSLCLFCRVCPRSVSTSSSRSSSSSGWWASRCCTLGTTSTRWSPSTTDRHFTSKLSLWKEREKEREKGRDRGSTQDPLVGFQTLDVLIKERLGASWPFVQSSITASRQTRLVLFFFRLLTPHLLLPFFKKMQFPSVRSRREHLYYFASPQQQATGAAALFFLLSFFFFFPPTLQFFIFGRRCLQEGD